MTVLKTNMEVVLKNKEPISGTTQPFKKPTKQTGFASLSNY